MLPTGVVHSHRTEIHPVSIPSLFSESLQKLSRTTTHIKNPPLTSIRKRCAPDKLEMEMLGK